MARAQMQMQPQQNAVQRFEKKHSQKLIAEMQQMVDRGQLDLPADYSLGNAITSAWLRLQTVQDRNHHPALDVCTPVSIANSIRDMVSLGLSPAKEQCYFIVYGSELTMRPSYFGYMMMAKRFNPNIADITAQVVYKNDTIETDMVAGKQCVTMHKTDPFAKHSISDAIGAYCNIIYQDGHWESTIMTIDEVHASWEVGGAQLGSKAHKLTPQDMIKRTVINKACRAVIRQSTDRTLFTDAMNRSEMNASLAERDEMVASKTNIVDVSFTEPHNRTVAAPAEVVEVEIIEPERTMEPEMPAEAHEPETAPDSEPEAEAADQLQVDPETGELQDDPDEYIPF